MSHSCPWFVVQATSQQNEPVNVGSRQAAGRYRNDGAPAGTEQQCSRRETTRQSKMNVASTPKQQQQNVCVPPELFQWHSVCYSLMLKWQGKQVACSSERERRDRP